MNNKNPQSISQQFGKHRCFVILLGILLVSFLYFTRFCVKSNNNQKSPTIRKIVNFSDNELKQMKIVRKCYEPKKPIEAVKLLDDIMASPPKLDRTIFFQDTSCLNGTVWFTSRQACTIESAARYNPKKDIFVLFASTVGFPLNVTSPILKALATYKNVHYRNVDWYKFTANTLAEEWIKEDRMLTTVHHKAHFSDFLRLVSLYKFGGIHLDLDFVVQKSFDNLVPTFIGATAKNILDNSVLGAESKGSGHEYAGKLLRYFIDHYSVMERGGNGPAVVRTVVPDICNVLHPRKELPDQCGDLKIYEHSAFYPIHSKYHCVTDPKVLDVLRLISRDSYAVHFNDFATKHCKMPKSGPQNIYMEKAREHCPKVWEASGDEF